jgi:hypothetical protein
MTDAIWPLVRQFLRAAETKVRLGRIADRPTAHRLAQFRNGHGFGYRHHNVAHRLGRGSLNHEWVKGERGIAGDSRPVCMPVGRAPRRPLVRQRSGHLPRTRIDTAREPEPVDLADHCATGNPMGKFASDTAGAPSFEPEFLQQLDSFIGPGHLRSIRCLTGLPSRPRFEARGVARHVAQASSRDFSPPV